MFRAIFKLSGVFNAKARLNVSPVGNVNLPIVQTCSRNSVSKLWNVDKRDFLPLARDITVTMKSDTAETALVLSRDAKHYIGCEDSNLCIWNSSTGEIKYKWCTQNSDNHDPSNHTRQNMTICGDRIVGSDNFNLCIFNSRNGEYEGKLKGHCGYITALESVNDTEVISAGTDGKVIMWNILKQESRSLLQDIYIVKHMLCV